MGDRVVTFAELAARNALEIGAGRPRSEPAGLPVLRVADVLEGRIQQALEAGDSAVVSQGMGSKASRPGDIVLTTKGTVGRIAIMPADGPTYAYSPQLCYFRLTDGDLLDRRFLYYWFKSTEFWKQADQVKGQTDMADFISLQDINSLRMQLSPLTEQRSIAEVLGALDDKIAANDRAASTARKLAQSVYQRAVHGAPTRPMAEVLEPFLGGTPSRADESLWDGSIPWASAKDITGARQGIVISTVEGITESATAAKRLRALPAGSVVLTARGTVGVVARLGIASAINQSCYGFVPGLIPGASMLHALEDASQQAKAMAHGSVFDTITMRTFDHVTIPDLSAEAWQRIESQLAPLIDAAQQMIVEAERLASTRDELLPLLMSGKLRVNDIGTAISA